LSSEKIIQSIYRNKAESLLRTLESSDLTKHNPTTGKLRENAIIESLNDIIPQEFELSSGFVVDSRGTISPQMDILVYQRGDLPSILLSHDSVVLPYELFKFGIEVKSTLEVKHFDQLSKQSECLNSMVESAFIRGSKINPDHKNVEFKIKKPLLFIIAIESNVAQETIKHKIKNIDALNGVYIINEGLYDRDDIVNITDNKLDNLLRIWSHIFMISQDLSIDKYLNNPQNINFLLSTIEDKGYDLSSKYEVFRILNDFSRQSLIPYLYPSSKEEDVNSDG